MDVIPTAQPGSQAQPAPQPVNLNPGDSKILLAQVTELVEAAVLRTETNPMARANEIHAIKAAYQKARYGAGDYSHDAD